MHAGLPTVVRFIRLGGQRPSSPIQQPLTPITSTCAGRQLGGSWEAAEATRADVTRWVVAGRQLARQEATRMLMLTRASVPLALLAAWAAGPQRAVGDGRCRCAPKSNTKR